MPQKNADLETKTKTKRTGSLWRILCLLLCSSDPVWAVPEPNIELGGHFSTKPLVMTCQRWSEVTANRDQVVNDAANGANSLLYRNTESASNGVKYTETFYGTVKFVGMVGMLAIISDDGCTVSVKLHTEAVDKYVPYIKKFGIGQALNDKAFATVPFQFKPDTLYDVKVDYSQTYYKPKPGQPDIDGATLYACPFPASITEVFERDQKWNKIPNPMTPLSYKNAAPAGSSKKPLVVGLEHKYLFVAVEPPADQTVQLTVKVSMNAPGGAALMCGIREANLPQNPYPPTTGIEPILTGSVPVTYSGENAGVAQIDFDPTVLIESARYRVLLGFDNNSDGQLSEDEVTTTEAPNDPRCFYVKAVHSTDFTDSRNWLNGWLPWLIAFPTAHNNLTYFMDNTAAPPVIADSTVMAGGLSIPITAHLPTHIAGSTYNQTTGTTVIPRFQFANGSSLSNRIKGTFNNVYHASAGLEKVIFDIWNGKQTTLSAQLTANPSRANTDPIPVTIPASTLIDFAPNGLDPILTDLQKSMGRANISGTITFKLRRGNLFSNRAYLMEIALDVVITDEFDFDWTVDPNTPTRRGANVQIFHELGSRNTGRIFATKIDLNGDPDGPAHNTDGLDWFNSHHYIDLTNPSPDTP